MSKRVFAAFEISSELKAGLEAVRARDGISLRFQVEKAIQNWLKGKGVEVTPQARRKRVGRPKKK